MSKVCCRFFFPAVVTLFLTVLNPAFISESLAGAPGNEGKKPDQQITPVRVSAVEMKTVSEQVSLIGTAEAAAESMVASEVSGIVEHFPAKEGDFVKKGQLIVKLGSEEVDLRIKGARAQREKIKESLLFAEKELVRFTKLKESNSIASNKYDEVLYNYNALIQELKRSEADIESLLYELKRKQVFAPISGFVAKEHIEVGEWVNAGGPVVTLVDLSRIKISVDVPERYAVLLSSKSDVKVFIKSLPGRQFAGKVQSVLPSGDTGSRTYPVRIFIPNPGLKIKSGMEATALFSLDGGKNALLVQKDAVVPAGDNKIVFTVRDGKALSVMVKVLGYYDGNAAVEGDLKPGDKVVIRGNERLRPGQPVMVTE
ncbi:MAG: efflux RND transporter periplasmic adaptor subunit [Desulfobacterales bacterium]|nr:efflux RND transporter periplasmic adaptor subunit [Desulfobacterales bacterium]